MEVPHPWWPPYRTLYFSFLPSFILEVIEVFPGPPNLPLVSISCLWLYQPWFPYCWENIGFNSSCTSHDPSLVCYRKRHLSSLLDVRGLWDPTERHQILGVLHDLEGADALPPCRGAAGFFSEISITHDTHCIHVSLSRASQFGRRTLRLFSRRRRITSNHVGDGPSPGEEDTQL